MRNEKTVVAARGRWRGILAELGVPESYLSGRHGPCPLCAEGKDRFRFDDREGRGTWICNQCGAGDGMTLAMRFTNAGFAEVASKIDAIIGNVGPDRIQRKPEMTDDQRRAMLNAQWRGAKRVEEGDLLHTYLATRGLSLDVPDDLRLALDVWDGEGGVRPAMLAKVRGGDGKPETLHRTFLRPDGSGKAEMRCPRKLMPGSVPPGSAIRLGPARKVLGIAEGIETALAASMMFRMPVWSVIHAAGMRSWSPPEGVSEVHIFGDCDEAFAGQEVAYTLARRLAGKVGVVVRLPAAPGDWNDVLLGKVPV